jgi:hypothetical protein
MFNKFFKKILDEDMTAGTGGVFGDFSSGQFSSDSYATGDYRAPKALGSVQRRNKKKKKRLKKK